MTDPQPPQTEDPIGVTLASIGSGASAGGIIVTASTMAVRILQVGQPDDTNAAIAAVLTLGVLAGLATAVAVAFRASRPIANLWRRSVTGAIALFGTAVISIIGMPLELFTGLPGLTVLIGLLVFVHLMCRRFLLQPAPAVTS